MHRARTHCVAAVSAAILVVAMVADCPLQINHALHFARTEIISLRILTAR
jgi:hypothetical protein